MLTKSKKHDLIHKDAVMRVYLCEDMIQIKYLPTAQTGFKTSSAQLGWKYKTNVCIYFVTAVQSPRRDPSELLIFKTKRVTAYMMALKQLFPKKCQEN